MADWTFLKPLKVGLPFWSQTKSPALWRIYVEQNGYKVEKNMLGIGAIDPKEQRPIGQWNERSGVGVFYKDVREDGLIITPEGLDFTG